MTPAKLRGWYLALSALYYYPFVLKGLEIPCYLFFYGVPCLVLLCNPGLAKRVLRQVLLSPLRYFAYVFCAYTILTVLVPTLHGTGDYSFFVSQPISFCKDALRFIALLVLFVKYISPECDFRLFLKYYVLATCCYVCGTLVLILSPDLKQFFYDRIKEGDHAKAVAMQSNYFTRYGWSGFSGFPFTFKCTLAVCVECFLLAQRVSIVRLRNLIPLGVLFVGNLFYGRIGMLVSAIFVVCFFFFVLGRKRPRLVLAIGLIVAVVLGALVVSSLFVDRVALWFDWLLAFVSGLFSGEGLGSESTRELFEDMLFVPDASTQIIGDGYYTQDESYYMHTDSGLMRPLLFGGALFAGIRYLLIVILLYLLHRQLQLRSAVDSLPFVWLLALSVLIFEIKGEVVAVALPILFPFVLACVICQTERNVANGC